MNKSNNQQGGNRPNQSQQQGQQGDSLKQPGGAPEKTETQPQQEQEKAPEQDGDKSSSPS